MQCVQLPSPTFCFVQMGLAAVLLALVPQRHGTVAGSASLTVSHLAQRSREQGAVALGEPPAAGAPNEAFLAGTPVFLGVFDTFTSTRPRADTSMLKAPNGADLQQPRRKHRSFSDPGARQCAHRAELMLDDCGVDLPGVRASRARLLAVVHSPRAAVSPLGGIVGFWPHELSKESSTAVDPRGRRGRRASDLPTTAPNADHRRAGLAPNPSFRTCSSRSAPHCTSTTGVGLQGRLLGRQPRDGSAPTKGHFRGWAPFIGTAQAAAFRRHGSVSSTLDTKAAVDNRRRTCAESRAEACNDGCQTGASGF